MKTQIINTVKIIFLLLFAAMIITLVSFIIYTPQSFAQENESKFPNSRSLNYPHKLSPNPNFHSSSTAEASTILFLPLVPHERQVPNLRSPFSLQIAALHQLSTNETELSALDESVYSSLSAALKDSGADWARVRVEWEIIDPNTPVPGELPEYDWQYHDENLRFVAETGVRMIATISDSPSWAASMPCAPIYPDRLDEYSRFLTDLVHHYKEPPFQIKHWELINEPDSNRYTSAHISGGCWAYDGDQYAQMLAVANQAIKEADPRATVLMGGIAYDWFEEYGGPFNRYFSDDVMENGGGLNIDGLNLHFYTDFHAEWDRWNPDSVDRRYGWIPAPTCGIVDDGVGIPYDVEGFDVIAKTTHFRNRMEVCHGVSKPVWLTEVGAHGYPDDQESLKTQARYVIKVYARALSVGVKNITWFSLDQPPYGDFGQALLNSDFSPKPAFFAYKTLTSELDGFYEYSHNRNICSWSSAGASCYVEAYVFKYDSLTEKTVAWGSRSLKFITSKLKVVDRNGKEIIIEDGDKGDMDGNINGIIKLKLSDEPVFITAW